MVYRTITRMPLILSSSTGTKDRRKRQEAMVRKMVKSDPFVYFIFILMTFRVPCSPSTALVAQTVECIRVYQSLFLYVSVLIKCIIVTYGFLSLHCFEC